MHKILILGPQGSGKGTQAKMLSQKLNVPALSMGQLLRDEVALGSELGLEIDAVIKQGNLVSDETALKVLEKRLHQPDAQKGYVLDGYPRNIAQYDKFKTIDTPTAVLLVDVPREESLSRMTKRAQIEARADDTPDVINKRLEVYETETKPVLDSYRASGLLREINGLGTVEEVASSIALALHV